MADKSLPFSPNYRDWKHKFETEPVYTRKEYLDALEKQAESLVVNRVIQKGKDVDIAMQILAIHKTPEGVTVIVR